MVKIDKTFGNRLKAEMKKRKISQPALAKRLDKTNTMVWNVVHGRIDPTRSIRSGLRQIRNIADALGCDMDDLYKLKEVNYADDI